MKFVRLVVVSSWWISTNVVIFVVIFVAIYIVNYSIQTTTNYHHMYKRTESTKTHHIRQVYDKYMTGIRQKYGKKGCMYNSETGSRIDGQMPMHKKGLVRVHIPGANGPRSPRMKCWRNWLGSGKWQRQVLCTKCTLSGESQLLGMTTRTRGSNCQGEFRSWLWGLGCRGCRVLGSSLISLA